MITLPQSACMRCRFFPIRFQKCKSILRCVRWLSGEIAAKPAGWGQKPLDWCGRRKHLTPTCRPLISTGTLWRAIIIHAIIFLKKYLVFRTQVKNIPKLTFRIQRTLWLSPHLYNLNSSPMLINMVPSLQQYLPKGTRSSQQTALPFSLAYSCCLHMLVSTLAKGTVPKFRVRFSASSALQLLPWDSWL